MERTFRLSSDIVNPKHDKRCKHGVRGVKVFKSGAIVRSSAIYDWVKPTYTVKCGEDRFGLVSFGEKLYDELANQDPGVDMPTQSLEEAAAQARMDISEFCRLVVRQLIKEGRLDPAETKELYEKTDENDW